MSNLYYYHIDADGLTLSVGMAEDLIPRGDENTPIPFAWSEMYRRNIDSYLYWLARIYRGYKVSIEARVVDGLMPPYSLMSIWLDGFRIDDVTAIKLGRQFAKEQYDAAMKHLASMEQEEKWLPQR